MVNTNASAVHDWQCDLGHLTLRGLCVNPHSERVVVAIHGFLDNANSMVHLAQAFPNHQMIAIDLAGHGLSDHRPPGAHYNQLDYVQDLHSLIQLLPVEEVILLGHSLGGIICAIYAAAFPDQVKAVVSIDAFGPLTQEADNTDKQIRAAVESRANKMESVAKTASLEAAVAARSNMTDLAVEHCQHILSRNIDTTVSPAIWRSDARLRTKSWMRMTSTQAKVVMSAIQCPMLVMAASKSFKQMSTTFAQRRAWVPQAKLSVFDGGHHIHMEQPEPIIAEIQQFVSNM